MKIGKIMLNTKLERHMVRPHALSREVSTFIYIYIYIYIDFQNIEKKKKEFGRPFLFLRFL